MSELSRLKKVCRYASIVMGVAAVVLAVLAVGFAVIGIWSMADGSISVQFFTDWLHLDENADGVVKVSACIQLVLIIALGSFTVAMLGMMMRSVSSEHSPFTRENAKRMKLMALIYLVASFLLLILSILRGMNVSETVFLFLGTLLVSVVSYCIALMCLYGRIL